MGMVKNILRFALALLFISSGSLHFLRSEFFVSIVPPYLPFPGALVAISGVAEILGGAGLLIPCFTRPAAWGLIALLIAVFPANLHMAMHADLYPQFSRASLLVRLPLQGFLIAWAWWYARSSTKDHPLAS
jgi:uncharacterized membrane protein